MDHKVSFDIFKNIIIAQNKVFLKHLAKETGMNEQDLLEKYIKPEYYLPVIKKTQQCQDPPKSNAVQS